MTVNDDTQVTDDMLLPLLLCGCFESTGRPAAPYTFIYTPCELHHPAMAYGWVADLMTNLLDVNNQPADANCSERRRCCCSGIT